MACKQCEKWKELQSELRDVLLYLRKENEKLKEERDGYRNGQQQMQSICNDLQDTIKKYADERKDLISKLAMMEKGKEGNDS